MPLLILFATRLSAVGKKLPSCVSRYPLHLVWYFLMGLKNLGTVERVGLADTLVRLLDVFKLINCKMKARSSTITYSTAQEANTREQESSRFEQTVHRRSHLQRFLWLLRRSKRRHFCNKPERCNQMSSATNEMHSYRCCDSSLELHESFPAAIKIRF
ncbi:hypothetical protein POX_a00170 [Penicillium oxalicum]|uniref:hypothetical protein n=1 Tax=Penicillium oxalicum TaxID=69781 RepID=UPI0020B7CCA6|nr:hypothetical protein POX_a00170 [Penicillium oxalicum]KAI2793589.1 hypothetical protein POX_a00170 [Penicillium oxalicum]